MAAAPTASPPGRGRTWSPASLVLLTLAAPALSLKTGFPDAGDNPTGQTERKAYDLLAEGFGPGFNAPLLVVADLQGTGARRRATSPRWPSASPPTPASPRSASRRSAPDGDTVVLPTLPTTEPSDPATVRDPRAGPGPHPRRGLRDRRRPR